MSMGSAVRRVPAGGDPSRADQACDRVVELEGDDRRTPGGGQPHHLGPVVAPLEMACPALTPRIEQPRPPPSQRIPAMRLDTFVPVTEPAGEPEIPLVIAPAAGGRDDVIDLQRAEHQPLWTVAVAAPIPRLIANPLPNRRRNPRTHPFSGSRRPRRTASSRACALRRSPSWYAWKRVASSARSASVR